MSRSFFLTGTDTGIGKTFASCALLRTWRAQGLRASGMKPVASGSQLTLAGLRNEDALALIAASDPAPAYEDCNPCAYEPPIAPHVAARLAQRPITLDAIAAAHARLLSGAERIVVEGVGGWLAPLSATLNQSDLVHALDLPVLQVVGIKLGCINHALLSARAIRADRCTLLGWIANRVDPDMPNADDSIEAIAARIDAPLLGTLAWNDAAPMLDLHAL